MKPPSSTPMILQYMKIKSRYSDALLFYRMGDFYELFFDDAEIAAAELNITLTKRGKQNGTDIPMCGVPCHSSESYLLNLIRKGHKVAICEQLETPEEAKRRGYKSIVKRDVVRLITPGTITEEGLLNEKQNNFLMSWKEDHNAYGIAWADVSTGDFYCTKIENQEINSFVNRILPSEILISNETEHLKRFSNFKEKVTFSALPTENFDYENSKIRLEKYFNFNKNSTLREVSYPEICAMGALLSYLEITQCNDLPSLSPPRREESNSYMRIDPASRKSLEIIESLNGNLKGSLLATVNYTLTNAGTRLLHKRLSRPETSISEIISRQDILEFFIGNDKILIEIRDFLKSMPDMQRSLSRLNLNRGSPKDLGVIRKCLKVAGQFEKVVESTALPSMLTYFISCLNGFDEISKLLEDNLVENLPSNIKDGNFIKSANNSLLRKIRDKKAKTQLKIIELQAKYIELTKVNSLKIKFNNVLGYFVETPSSQLKKMSSNELSGTFFHRQTTTNSIRFSTNELGQLAETLVNSHEELEKLELEIFDNLVSTININSSRLIIASNALSEIDLFTSLSFLSIQANWTRPKIDSSKMFTIEGGRHPVVESSLKSSGADGFISNNCNLSCETNSILLVTGPNMAGKSTYLRQNALITILAQMGSYVPASFAHIGIVDQIFSRVGSSDDLSRGQSTFMVEMNETASILKNATESSLIIMDEVGRGTATYDGLSIAWGILEHIHEITKCRTIFATHYHELTQLEKTFPKIKNAKVAIREWKDEVIFLHEVKYGKADKSYGIQVAKLAGLPETIISKAEKVLSKLEENENNIDLINISSENLNENPKRVQIEKGLQLLDHLSSLNSDNITPKEAHSILDEIILSAKTTIQIDKL